MSETELGCMWLFPLVCAGAGCWGGVLAGSYSEAQAGPQPPKHWAFRHAAVRTSAPSSNAEQHPGLLVPCVGGEQCHLATRGKLGSDPAPTPHSRFRDKEWIRPADRRHFLAEFPELQKVPVEAVDASGCAINYQGLSNLREWAGVGGPPFGVGLREGLWCHLPSSSPVPLKELRSLSLQRCPNLDDWCLSRLYLLAGSLQELSLAGCPRISERGLACLHHLQ